MTKDEYQRTRERIAYVTGLVKQLELEAFLAELQPADKHLIGPLAEGLREFQKVIERVTGKPARGGT